MDDNNKKIPVTVKILNQNYDIFCSEEEKDTLFNSVAVQSKIGVDPLIGGTHRMTSDEFWGLSIQEFFLASEGFSEFHSGGKPPPLRKDELSDLMERYPD